MRTFKWVYNIDTYLAEMVLVWTELVCPRLGTKVGFFFLTR
jgi:hypothetical protein